jgi:hypothetical protein
VIEFQNPKIHTFKSPLLKDIQKVAQEYVVLQALSGVNGAQVSDGKQDPNVKVDPYNNLGGHEVSILMRKSTFVKLLGRVNKNRPLFKGWCEQYDPDAPFVFPEDQPMIGEGTGDVDPSACGYRNNLLEAYRYLMLGNKVPVFNHWKLVQWQSPTEINDFYRCFLSFVVPELYDLGYGNASFTAMTQDPKTTTWTRGFSYQDLMRPHPNIGLRVDAAMNEVQAKTVRRVASFFPSVTGYVLPGPAEKCRVRSKLKTRMSKITETMNSLNRVVPRGKDNNVLVADFYPTYYQCQKKNIEGICELIKEKPQIVAVKVTEEAITNGLGGFRVAFSIDMTTKPRQLIRELQTKVEQRKVETARTSSSPSDQLRELRKMQEERAAFWKQS